MLLIALASLTAVQAQPSPTIVVTGQRIDDFRASLEACLARNCPTDQDIDASLALAESQILAGKYKDARRTLLASLGRNSDEARHYPIPVSDLYRANGKVAASLGYDDDFYRSTWGIYRTLKEGLPSDAVRQFSAKMEVAEMMGRTRGHERARLYYDSIAEEARREGRPDIAAIAELRSAIRHLPPGSSWQVSAIRRIAALKGADMRAPVLEAKLALARMAYEKGDEGAAQAIQRDFAALKIRRPILIYAPSYEMIERDTTSTNEILAARSNRTQGTGLIAIPGSPTARVSSRGGSRGPATFGTSRIAPNVDDMWIDVGFRITPDGRVADAKIMRSKGDTFWTEPLMVSLRARRYTPGRLNDPASHRLERYTYTSGYEGKTMTRMAGRSPNTRVEFIDLTPMGLATPD